MKEVSQELVGGYNLNARLLELLGHPLDSRGQGEAMSICQELSRVFMVSLFMLRPDNGGAEEVRTAPEVRKDDGGISRLLTPAKDKRISGEGASQLRNGRQEEVTRREITPSPHKDGYRWRKYGQKIIRNTKFERYYYRCALSRDRRCRAKKQVQEQDNSRRSSDPPVFEVTYLHEHTCELALSDEDVTVSPVPASSTGNGASSDPSQGGSVEVEVNEAIVSCLAMVISGSAPSSSPLSLPPPLPPAAVEAYVQDGGYHLPSLDGSMAAAPADMDHFSTSSYGPSSLYSPVEATDQLINHCDVHPDTASAWTYRGCVVWN